jgi:hypothetical protein
MRHELVMCVLLYVVLLLGAATAMLARPTGL